MRSLPWKRLLFALAPAVALLLGAEAVLRVAWRPPPEVRGAEAVRGTLLHPHPTRLWAPAPGALDNFGVPVRIDEDHLRAEVAGAAGPLVLTLGDSSVFGHGLTEPDTLHARLHQALAARGVDARVRTLAIPGYSTEQLKVVLEEVGWDMGPALLVVGAMWSDSNVDHFQDRVWLEALRAPGSRLRRLARRTRLVQWLSERAPIEETGQASNHTAVTWVQDATRTGLRRVPLQDYAANLDGILAEAAARGVGAVVLTPCSRSRLASSEGTFAPYVDAMARVAARRGTPQVDACAALTRDGDAWFLDALHPNGAANARYADALADALVAAGWPTRALLPSPAAPFDTPLVDPYAPTLPATAAETRQALLAALDTMKDDPLAGLAACAAIGEPASRELCAMAVIASDRSLGTQACALPAEPEGCWMALALATREPRWCARAGARKEDCWRELSLRPEAPWLQEGLTGAALVDAVSAQLTRAGLPVDHAETWRFVFSNPDQDCAAYEGTVAERFCADRGGSPPAGP
ncbi:MAG: SGNH/GDSL hydrolase family protein [Alphaproteobacteria bacterium]|nr:SGNH/GDSL hydrolase family protein [Alphaproteobacteria bacterium]